MNLIKLTLITVLITLLTSCDKPAPLQLTAEQAVYESLFVKRIENTYSKYFLAGATENEWFINNPIEDTNWENSLNELGNISVELVEELYRVNSKSYSLNWRPIITNAEILPPHFAMKANPQNRNERCMVESGKGNVGIVEAHEGEYRSYYSVSKVAFTKDGKKALMKFSYLCAPLSGAGEFFVAFEYRENEWYPIGSSMLWIS